MPKFGTYGWKLPDRVIRKVPNRNIVEVVQLECPDCGGCMYRRFSDTYGRHFYSCENRPTCRGSIGCHPSGAPLGIPMRSEDKKWRIEAHAIFDRLWKEKIKKRNQAYKWLAVKMDMDEVHIGSLDVEGCQRVIQIVEKYLSNRKRSGKKR